MDLSHTHFLLSFYGVTLTFLTDYPKLVCCMKQIIIFNLTPLFRQITERLESGFSLSKQHKNI